MRKDNKDLYEMSNKLLDFCEKYKDEISYDDLNNFHELWTRIFDSLQTGESESKQEIVDDMIENVDTKDYTGDYTAVNANDVQGKISLCGIGGSEDDFTEEGVLPKGKYILFRAIKVIEIDE
tara:strand:- start:1128 stop:1493 length:366 start_codon:yes stop_codon:yes gene_type:complete